MTTRERAAAIRRTIRKVAPTVSVRMGRGTARSWIEIQGSGPFERFTDDEQRALATLGLQVGIGNAYPIPGHEANELLKEWVAEDRSAL